MSLLACLVMHPLMLTCLLCSLTVQGLSWGYLTETYFDFVQT